MSNFAVVLLELWRKNDIDASYDIWVSWSK